MRLVHLIEVAEAALRHRGALLPVPPTEVEIRAYAYAAVDAILAEQAKEPSREAEFERALALATEKIEWLAPRCGTAISCARAIIEQARPEIVGE